MAKQSQQALPVKSGEGAPAPKREDAKSLALIEQVGQELQTVTERNFYVIHGRDGDRKEPDARALQHFANKVGGISTHIIDAGIDDDHAWARVSGFLLSNPLVVKEDQVTINFKAEFERLIWDRVDKGCARHKQVGCPLVKDGSGRIAFEGNAPVLSDSVCQLTLRQQLNRIIAFGDRTCITKAEARLHKKLLNFEWRDEDEIDHEKSEVDSVNAGNRLPAAATANADKTTQDAAKPAATGHAAASQSAKAQEQPKAQPANTEAPKATAAAPKPAVSAPMAPVRANVPPMEPTAATQPAAAAPKAVTAKPRSKRLEEIGNATKCSTTNLTVFLCRHLGAADTSQAELAKLGRVKIDATIQALEETLVHYNVAGFDAVGAIIRDETPRNEEINNFFLSRYKEALG